MLHVQHSSILKHVSRETLGTLHDFAALLLRWNRRLNLVGRADEPALWSRHIADSLQLLPFLNPPPERAVDLGSGAGFPGLVLAVATGALFHLVEADQRKAAFLREAARVTKAPVLVHAHRIESLVLPSFPVVTARALAPLPRLLELAAPLIAPGGTCLFLKGAGGDAELTLAESQWQMQVEAFPSQTAPGAQILRITKLSRVASGA